MRYLYYYDGQNVAVCHICKISYFYSTILARNNNYFLFSIIIIQYTVCIINNNGVIICVIKLIYK